MAESHQNKDVNMSNTSSLSQGTTSLAIRNRPAPQDMVAVNTTISSTAKDAILHAAANVGTDMRQLVRDLAHSADPIELGLAQLRIHDVEAAKVANAAAILKLQQDAQAAILKIQQEAGDAIQQLQDNAKVAAENFAYFDYENQVLAEAQRNNEGWQKSVRRRNEQRLDRLEGLMDIFLLEKTMPDTEETRVSITNKIDEFKKADKAKRAAEDAEVL